MSSSETPIAEMPDIASDADTQVAGKLDWVGMNEIEMPVRVDTPDQGTVQYPAHISAFVNLDNPGARGIHMSRLYLQLDEILGAQSLNPATLRHLLSSFLESHAELSEQAMVRIDLEYQIRRPSLASGNTGWRRYPVSIIGRMREREFHMEIALQVLYSSTCPCSAALSRQLVQQRFELDWAGADRVAVEAVRDWLGDEDNIVATPHAQRSVVDLRVQLAPSFEAFPVTELLDLVEGALKTPVQAAVKREDERAFARLNGENLMFCEDAGRRVRSALMATERIQDFWARCRHFESLHPHNAVAIVTKGVEGGYQPIDAQHWN